MDQLNVRRLSAALMAQQDTLAELWHSAVEESSFVPLSRAEVRQRLGQLIAEVVAWLAEDEPLPGRPRQIGAGLADLHFLQSDALEGSLLFLGQTLGHALSTDLKQVLVQRLPPLLAGVAAGYHARAQEMVFAEQEWMRLSLLDAQAHARQAVEETEARFRLLVEQAADAIYLHDLDGNVLDFNQRALDWLGYTRDELMGMHVGDVDPTMPREFIAERLHQLRSGLPQTLATEHRRKDGTLFPVEVSLGVIDSGDQPLVLSIARDISVRKQAEETLRRNETIFHALSESAVVAIGILRDGQPVYANHAAEVLLGMTRDALLAQPLESHQLPERMQGFRQRAEEVAEGRVPFVRYEGFVSRLDGEIAWVDVTISAIEYEGAPALLVTSFDITDRKRTEAALAESESKFRTLAESTNAAIFMYRGDRNIYVNAAAQSITGYSMDELVAMPFWSFIRQDYQDVVRDRGLARLHGQEIVPRYEVPIVHKDGQVRWVEFTGSLIDFDGQPTVLGTAFDVTERRLALKQLQQVARRLEVLSDIDRAALGGEPLGAVAQRGLDLAIEMVSAHRGSVTILDQTTDEAIVLVTRSLIGPDQLPGWRHRMPLGAVEVLRRREIHYVADVRSRAAWMPIETVLDELGVRSYINVPLIVQGELIGSLNLSSTQPGAFGAEAAGVLREAADRLALAIYNARLFEEVESSRQRLQQLSRRLVAVQEEERRSIARELHDEIGQTLTGLKITLEMAIGQPADAARDSLLRALPLADELVARARQMSIQLRPPMLDDLGLLHTLLWHFERYAEQTHIEVHFEHRSLERRYAPELEMASYRIVQEALTNVARHARVDRVKVRLWNGEDTLNIQVEDAGAGFDYASASRLGQSNGLVGMAERARLLGGQFGVESAPGAGTCITVTFPLGNGASS